MPVQEIVVNTSSALKRAAQPPQRVTRTHTPRPGTSWPKRAKPSGSSSSKDSGVEVDSSDTTQRCSSATPSSSSLTDICRICHCDAEEENPLISPCRCSGSLQFVHQSCLQMWLKAKDQKHCELCNFNFNMAAKTKPFKEWEKLSMTQTEQRKIICSVTFHVIAITCVVWSLYVLIDRVVEEVRAGVLEWPFWTKLIVIAIGFTGGVVFMYVQCKMYAHYFSRWRAYNKVLIIRNALPADLQAGAAGPASENAADSSQEVVEVLSTSPEPEATSPV